MDGSYFWRLLLTVSVDAEAICRVSGLVLVRGKKSVSLC